MWSSIIFIIINDLPKSLNYSKVSLYADDTVIYVTESDIKLAENLLQQDLNSLQNWCNMNKLTINCKKTKYCVYGMRSIVKKSKAQNLVLSLNNQILDRVCSYKYLGFALDEHLNFNKHIKDMKQLITHKLYLLSKIRRYITFEASINIFKTMVLSLIEYGDIIYNGTMQNNLNDIDKLFYRGLRICVNANNYVSKQELCAMCKISTLEKRHDCHLMLFMHKQSLKECLLKKKIRETRMHSAPVFNTYKPNNEKSRNNIIYKGAIEWNNLPANVRNLNFNDFKSLQKKNLKL